MIREDDFRRVSEDVRAERDRHVHLVADETFGWDCADPTVDDEHKLPVLVEEIGEVATACITGDTANLYEELIQIAAVAHAWAESLRPPEGRVVEGNFGEGGSVA